MAGSNAAPSAEPVIAQHGVEHRVRLSGRVSDTDRLLLYQAAHAYITPSVYEGFGLTPLEAMALDWILVHPEYHADLGSVEQALRTIAARNWPAS